MKTKTSKKYYPVKLWRRVTAYVMSFVLLLQIMAPGIAAAAIVITDNQIESRLMANYQFQPSSSTTHLYERALYVGQDLPANTPTISSLHKNLVAAKKGLPAPTFIPIAGDITLFVPVHILGKLVGDTYVQNRYVRDQITDLLGRHMINAGPGVTELTQNQALYDVAYDFATTNVHGYFFGKPIAADFTISRDMIWPEWRIINGQSVLVPIVYLSNITLDTRGVKDHTIEFAGGSAEFANIVIDNANLLLKRSTFVNVLGNVINKNGTITADQNLNLNVKGSLQNLSGTISAQNNISIVAGQFSNKTIVHPYVDKNGSGTRLGAVAGFNSVNGNISIKSYGDVLVEGGTVDAGNGSITFNAAGNIIIKGLATNYTTTSKDGHWQVNQSTLEIFKSHLNAKETIQLIAGGSIEINASDLISTHGGIELLAENGIHILDSLEQTSIQKSDRIGKTKGTASEFTSHAVRAILKTGKGVLLDTDTGDVILRAAQIDSADGAKVYAHSGGVHLLMTKELEERHLQTTSKGTWTIKTRTEDVIHENNIQNAIVGGLQVQAKYGINIEYTGVDGLSLKDQIDQFRKMPELKWAADLYDQSVATGGQSINWEVMEEVHKELKRSKSHLSPAAMAIIAIVVAVATGGAGAGMFGAIKGAIVGATQGAIGATAAAALGTALASGAVALTTQAAQSLAAGNNIRETFNAMDSDESLKSLAVAMVTAGALEAAKVDLFHVPEGSQIDMANLTKQASQAVVNSTVSAGVSTAIYGGNKADFLKAFNASLASNAVNTIGSKISGKIANSPSFEEAQKYIAHAAMGCLTSGLTNKIQDTDIENGCVSGAGSAVITQVLTADGVKQKLDEWGLKVKNTGVSYLELEKQATYFQSIGVDVAKLISAFSAYALGGDVNAAISSADMVAKANVYKAINLMGIYAEINGVGISSDPERRERIKSLYIKSVRDALAEKNVSAATINSLISKLEVKGVFNSVADFESASVTDPRNIDKIVDSRAKDTFQIGSSSTSDPYALVEIGIYSAPFDDVVNYGLDFLGATNRTVNILSPEEKQVIGIAFNVLTGGPLKTILNQALDYGKDKILPPEIADTINEIPVVLGSAGVGFLTGNNYSTIKDEYPYARNEEGIYDVKDWVDGMTWLASNITGLPDKRGTNTPTYIHQGSSGNPNNGNSIGNKILPTSAKFTSDFDEHAVKGLKNENGTHKISKNGSIDGAHNKDEFEGVLGNPRGLQPPVPAIYDSEDVRDASGRVIGTRYAYQVPALEGGKIKRDAQGNVVYKSEVQIKTTYDPRVISDQEYLAAAKRVSQLEYEANGMNFVNSPDKRQYPRTDPVTGIKFMVNFRLNNMNDVEVNSFMQ